MRAGVHSFLPVEAIYLDDPDGNEVEIVTARDPAKLICRDHRSANGVYVEPSADLAAVVPTR